jgi:maleamate amidohydrolase
MRYQRWDVDSHCWTALIDGETAARYAAYERELYVGVRPVLLVVDAYEKVLGTPLQTSGPNGQSISTGAVTVQMRALMSLFREAGLPVVHATDIRAIGEMGGAPLQATNRPVCGQDAAPYRFVAGLEPRPGEAVVHKMRASAFYGTPLHAMLTHGQHDSVVVVGQTTSGCVRATVVDAFSAGFHVAVIEDACFDRSFLSHAVNLFDMHHKYADVMSQRTVASLVN